MALRDAIDHGSKAEFEKTFDGCRQHAPVVTAAGTDFLVIQRPTAPLLDNLRTTPLPAVKAKD